MKKTAIYFITTIIVLSCNSQPKSQNTSLLTGDSNVGVIGAPRHLANENVSLSQKASSFTTKNHGIGKVRIVFEFVLYEKKSFSYEILTEPKENCTKTELKLIWNESNNGFVQALNDDIVKIRDYHIDEPYYIILFDCLKTQNGFCEIIVNDQTKETKWIKTSENIIFEPWEVFLKNVVCISQLDSNSNPVRLEPDVNSETIQEQGNQCWEVDEMRGDWVKIKYSELDLDPNEEELSRFRGWLKWKDEESFLIKYYLAV